MSPYSLSKLWSVWMFQACILQHLKDQSCTISFDYCGNQDLSVFWYSLFFLNSCTIVYQCFFLVQAPIHISTLLDSCNRPSQVIEYTLNVPYMIRLVNLLSGWYSCVGVLRLSTGQCNFCYGLPCFWCMQKVFVA